MQVLSNDIFAFYNHYLNEAELRLPELRIQYKDYAVWQRSQSNTLAYKTNKKFWNARLAGNIPRINLRILLSEQPPAF